MNTLMPPPRRDLPEDVRREVRGTLVRTSRATTGTRHTRGRVLVPALALTGLVGATAAVGLSLPGTTGRPVTAVPMPAAPVSAATMPPAQTTRSPAPTVESMPAAPVSAATMPPARTTRTFPIPAAESIDRGPLSSATTDTIVKNCLYGSPGGGTADRVHIARQTSIGGGVVVLTDTAGILHLCRDGMDITGPPLDAGGPMGDLQRPAPTERQPVVQLAGYAGSGGGPALGKSGPIENTDTSYYRVGPEVASLQVRLTVDGHTGPWTQAIIADGYAWACAAVDYPFSKDDPAPDITQDDQVDDRAFDATGHELEINHVSR